MSEKDNKEEVKATGYVKLRDGGTIFDDRSQGVSIVGKLPKEVTMTSAINKAVKNGLLIKVSESDAKTAIEEYAKKFPAAKVPATKPETPAEYKELQKKFNDLTAESVKSADQLNAITKEKKEADTKLTEANAKIKTLEEAVASGSEVDTTELDAQIKTLTDEKAALETEVTSLTTAKETAEIDLQTAQSDLDSVAKERDDLQTANDTLSTEKDELTAEVKDLKKQVADLKKAAK